MTKRTIQGSAAHGKINAKVQSLDPIWAEIRQEAGNAMAAEPALGSFIFATVLRNSQPPGSSEPGTLIRSRHLVIEKAAGSERRSGGTEGGLAGGEIRRTL